MKRILGILRRLPHVAWFIVVFVRELIVANVRVAWEVVTPGFGMRAGIIRVPTDCRTDLEMLLLANTITMTPGTLSLEVDTATNDLYVHSLYVPSREEFIAGIKALEAVLLKALR